MIFHGLQKMTLLDYPGKVAATVFTGGCNLRCPFCHNATLVTGLASSPRYTEEEILRFLEGRVGLLDGVAISGGEPLMQTGIENFCKKVRALGFSVKLDTNGTYPEMLGTLIEEGLVDYVAMDVKNAPEKYAMTVGIPDFDLTNVRRSVELLKEGRVDYEFRTTVVRELHTEEDIRKISEWLAGAGRWFLQNFVDSGNLIGQNLHPHSKETLETMQKIGAEKMPFLKIRGI